MSTILITGANGFIGQHIVKHLVPDKLHRVIATGKAGCHLPFQQNEYFQYVRLDITDRFQVQKVLSSHLPDIVIHAAALGQPDFCEEHKEDCIAINIEGTRNIAQSCTEINCFLVFLSSDFVFDGNNGPYREEDEINPVNFYGSSKATGEKILQQVGTDHAVARLCSVYGIAFSGSARNIITWVKENLENNIAINAVADQVRTPTFIDDAVQAIITLGVNKIKGIYHISGEETFTPYDMAIMTAGYLKLDEKLVQKVLSSDLHQPALRPLRTGFITDKAKKAFDFSTQVFMKALKKILQ